MADVSYGSLRVWAHLNPTAANASHGCLYLIDSIPIPRDLLTTKPA